MDFMIGCLGYLCLLQERHAGPDSEFNVDNSVSGKNYQAKEICTPVPLILLCFMFLEKYSKF